MPSHPGRPTVFRLLLIPSELSCFLHPSVGLRILAPEDQQLFYEALGAQAFGVDRGAGRTVVRVSPPLLVFHMGPLSLRDATTVLQIGPISLSGGG
jgi:hypothetical protein